ncbi:uncharacterized protein K460DRAFT_1708 [Cucurbitaria berberidis CBS 394.84]|uniref:Prp 4 CRoW domain-containing protein n=1 Tax=Cucurbitaria berberidis CBS 394.84 TaxID=1168544 RepID=A0A9P4LD02_9PLEO|nr:uncharacterized protein K460DRAFT_1708 [Cucurbitaria berberidis CBS 394.84]KAF1849664.1 hypothetical protein K460DRAFT_1708 [Cucurbitaria berberidis CBS 394.84]
MYISILTLGLLSTSALAMQAFTNADSFGAMLKRGDAIAKRQGYYPNTNTCGRGDTCEKACGPNQVQCPSKSLTTLYCHSSIDGSHCCSDGSGKSCRKGFYCTSDGAGKTYCCPDGIDTPECARQYSLTVSLIRESSTAAFSSAAGSSVLPAETPVTSSTPIHVSILPTGPTSLVVPTGKPNATYSGPSLPEFTGGASKIVGAGMVIVAGLAGLVFF